MSLNRGQIITLVLSRCGRAEGNTYLAAQAVTELQLIQDRLEQAPFMPWFLLSDEITTLSTVALTRALSLPTNFLREWDDFPVYRYDSTATEPYIRLNKDEFNYLKQRYAESGSGPPTEYCLSGMQLDFFPTPDLAYPLRVKWYEREAVLSADNTENEWTQNAADLLVGELGMVISGSYKRDEKMQGIFAQEIIRANARLLAFDEARKQALRDAMRGDRDRP